MRKRAPTPPQTRPSPSAFIDATTPVTYLLFSYLSPLIAYGRKNQITLEDTPLLRKQDTAEAVADRLQTAWEKNKNAKHGIWWALVITRIISRDIFHTLLYRERERYYRRIMYILRTYE